MNSELLPRSTTSQNRRSAVFSFVVILIAGLATITTNCADPDLWGHVQYGREVIRDGVLPRTATWTYAAEGAPWVNHENIAELLLAWTVDTFGPSGLPWMKLTIAAMILSLLMMSARKAGTGWLAIGVMVVLVAANVQFHWHFRPQILTYLSLAGMLALWQHAFNDFRVDDEESVRASTRRLKWLWLMPPLMCFWANSHGGFAAGVAILAAYHGLICLMLVVKSGLRHRSFVVHLSLITITSVAATLVNPYGVGLWKFMLSALKLPRPEIADWGPLELWNNEAIRFWCLIGVSALSLCFRENRRNLPQLAIMGLLLWQGMSHCRHLSIFSIVCGFWMPGRLQSVVNSVENTLNRLQPERVGRGFGRLSSVACGLILLISLVKLAPMMTEVEVDRTEYPVSAMQYMHDQNLHGKVLVTFNWAQYAIGCFAEAEGSMSQSRVGVDGRFETCYPREITDICFDFWLGTNNPAQRYRSPKAPAFDTSRALEFHQPDLVLIAREQNPSVRVIEQHRDEWSLLYQDSIAQLWGRSSKYCDTNSPDFIAPDDYLVNDADQRGTVPWPALPVSQGDGSPVQQTRQSARQYLSFR